MNIFRSRLGLFFYLPMFALWCFFSLPILAGIDIRRFVGKIAVLLIPVYALFLLASVILHFIAVKKGWQGVVKALFVAHFAGIVGYVIFVFFALHVALYR